MKPKNVAIAQEFGEIPVHQCNLFAVLKGVPLDTMVCHANCIVDGLREMAENSVQAGGMDAAVSWLMGENLKTVSALLLSMENALHAGRVLSEDQP